MQKQAILLLLGLGVLIFPAAGWAQAIMSGAGAYSAAGGLGAGLAASSNHGAAVTRSYEAMIKTQAAILAQTQVIEKYMTLGCQFEAAKQWENAEKSFKYVLQMVAKRDGPGSNKGMPALQHLVAVSKAQNKLDDAIGFQKTVLAFTKAAAKVNPAAVINENLTLSNLYVQHGDYASAEPLLKDTVTLCEEHSSLSTRQIKKVRASYVEVLRGLHKDSEADALESANLCEDKNNNEATAPENKVGKSDTVPEAAMDDQKSESVKKAESVDKLHPSGDSSSSERGSEPPLKETR